MTPLYACHGIGTHSGFFLHQRAGLAPRPVIGVDMPGFGEEPLTAPVTFPALALGLAQRIGAGPAHVIGHSMGGMVALELAATRPALFSSLILCNTTPAFGGRDDSFKTQFVQARLAPLDAGKTMAEMAPDGARAICGPNARAQDIDTIATLMAQTSEAAYRAAIECLVTFDRREALERLDMPVLVIGGEDDQASPARSMEKMAAKIKGAECHILPGGHMTPIEQADQVNTLISAFLSRVETA